MLHLLILTLLFEGGFNAPPAMHRNLLRAEYGVNFRYIGNVRYNLDRVQIVTTIPIPKFSDIKIEPLDYGTCDEEWVRGENFTRLTENQKHLVYKAVDWCTKAIPYMEYLQDKEKSIVDRLKNLLVNDLYAALPELKP